METQRGLAAFQALLWAAICSPSPQPLVPHPVRNKGIHMPLPGQPGQQMDERAALGGHIFSQASHLGLSEAEAGLKRLPSLTVFPPVALQLSASPEQIFLPRC